MKKNGLAGPASDELMRASGHSYLLAKNQNNHRQLRRQLERQERKANRTFTPKPKGF